MLAQIRIIGIVVAGMCLGLSMKAPVCAGTDGEAQGKDFCLLYGENCPDRKESITEIIEHLQREIARGEVVYTKEELKRLQRKLDEYEWLLYTILYSPSR